MDGTKNFAHKVKSELPPETKMDKSMIDYAESQYVADQVPTFLQSLLLHAVNVEEDHHQL